MLSLSFKNHTPHLWLLFAYNHQLVSSWAGGCLVMPEDPQQEERNHRCDLHTFPKHWHPQRWKAAFSRVAGLETPHHLLWVAERHDGVSEDFKNFASSTAFLLRGGWGAQEQPLQTLHPSPLPHPSPNMPQTPPTRPLPLGYLLCLSVFLGHPLGIFLVKPCSSLSPPHPSACPSVPPSFPFLVIMSCAHHFSPFPDWKFLQASQGLHLTHVSL